MVPGRGDRVPSATAEHEPPASCPQACAAGDPGTFPLLLPDKASVLPAAAGNCFTIFGQSRRGMPGQRAGVTECWKDWRSRRSSLLTAHGEKQYGSEETRAGDGVAQPCFHPQGMSLDIDLGV